MTGPLLEVRELCVEFPTRRGALRALDGVSFDIAHGEILGIVGESGAGKSLTGAAIIGLLEPPGQVCGGQIVLQGRRIDDLPRDAMRRLRGKRIGTIFQDPLTSLDPLYTIGHELVETLRTHLPLGAAQARERAIALLRQVGLPAPEARLAQYPHEFSGGMRQRVVIALALAGEPTLVIADEPTTALDVAVQAQIIRLLRSITQAHGTSVMLITHDMGVIAETCDRVAVMYAGRIVEIGPVDEVIHRPAHPYTVGLMASVPSLADVGGRLAQIQGALPRLGETPSGCAFHPRCPKASPRCSDERPELALVQRTRAACWWPILEGPGA
jgi:peptide/nickel transport system ATP-binding protein